MTEFDAVIVGSGAAGAAAAWRLSSQGFKVACLERGSWMDPAGYPSTRPDWELLKQSGFNPVSSRRNGPADYPVDDSESPIAVCNYNAVGGSTILYSAHFPRFRPEDFHLKKSLGIADDWPLGYDELRPYFELNEEQMSVAGLAGDPLYPDMEKLLPPVPIGKAGAKMAKAFNELGWHWWPSYSAISTRSRNGRAACLNLGPCNTGCPQGAKSSVDVTYLPMARQCGLKLITEAAVSHVLMEGNVARGVAYFDEEGKACTIRARKVILAASAVGTPRILLNSASELFPTGIGNRWDQVGRNLMIHPLGYVEGIFEEELDTDVGPQGCMIYSLEHYRTPDEGHDLGYMMHVLRGTGPVEAAQAAYARRKLKFGNELYADFDAFFRKQLVISLICEDLPVPDNRVVLDLSVSDAFGVPGVKVKYAVHENSKRMMIHGMTNAKKVLMTAGARRTYAYGPVRETGWHVMGTARMGEDPGSSVVSPDGTCHGTENLHILDSSVFVTGSCVNPANTIQAVALYLSDRIGDQMREMK